MRIFVQKAVTKISIRTVKLLSTPGVNFASSATRYSSSDFPMETPKTNVKGEYVRKESSFRSWITEDGSSGFKAEADRYHLYVSLACPWAHRTLVTRALKGLDTFLPVTVVDWRLMGQNGWTFTDKVPKCEMDPVNGAKFVKEIYFKSDPNYDGRFSVPVLWDKKTNTIVNNESSEILRMLNRECNAFCSPPEKKDIDLYPEHLQGKIEEINGWIYPMLNNGVYRAGFAESQEAYDVAVREVFEGLDKVESILVESRFLTGSALTEADVRLFTTLVRFDTVYHGHFKCNKKRVIDYPNIWGFVRDLYQMDGVESTVDQDHIQNHYMQSQKKINPFGIVPIGPDLDFNAPHGRDTKFNVKG